MKKVILFLIVLASISEGCKKYPEGPCISFRSAKHRLYGKYILSSYTVDGIDSLDLYYDSLSKNFDFYYNDVNYYDDCLIGSSRKDGQFGMLYWHWNLINNKKTLNVYESIGTKTGTGPSSFIGPFGDGKQLQWNILRLTKDEVKMKTNYNGKEYLMLLKK